GAGYPLARAGDALVCQLCVDPGSAVGAPGCLVDLNDALCQGKVGKVLGGRAVGCPDVVGGTGNLEQVAGPRHVALLFFLRLDERVQIHRVSLAKKAVALLRMSRSSRSMRFSLRSRLSSSRSAVVSPSRRPVSMSAWRIQSR